ncbi:P-loop containing nucleoside triphosphate hydrolase protein [Aspergillus undulatus]|uniref:P-loop containing nucleoside triphosphate hydrolase protein n=1 Tax=Aspergillus undulatus TaxID=1810928 RepID=UPI003CCE22F0
MYCLLDTCGQAWVDCLRKQAFLQVLNQGKVYVVTQFSQLVLSLAICWKVTLVALSTGPVIYAITKGFETTSETWDRRNTAARTSASEVFLETFFESPIQINHLTFRYPTRPDDPILRNISTAIQAGSYTAIVGRSGSDKSTIASLLLSLCETPANYKPLISIAGLDIRDLHTPSLRSLISQNIAYALDAYSPLATLFNVRAAARAAGIDDFISSLPRGYETVRVVVARALVRRPQILILDEATSVLDPTSAEIIRQTVRRLVAERSGLTVLVSTHARDMMEVAGCVVVLEGGKLRGLIERPEDDSH